MMWCGFVVVGMDMMIWLMVGHDAVMLPNSVSRCGL